MINVIHILAESPINVGEKWYWVDILAKKLYSNREIPFGFGCKLVAEFSCFVSNLIPINEEQLLLSNENNLAVLSLLDKKTSEIVCFEHQNNMRCNDGSVGPDGKYWFGTMEKSPSGLNGELYSLNTKGELVAQDAQIGIPNSFVWLDDKFVLISDSFLQQTFKVELLASGMLDWPNREIWLDLSDTDSTPDGGALDAEGNVWLAIWGGAAVHKYSASGELIDKIELAALQPTSCAFGGESMDELLITTATEGMREEQLGLYPDSGKVLLHKMNIKGKVLPVFELEV